MLCVPEVIKEIESYKTVHGLSVRSYDSEFTRSASIFMTGTYVESGKPCFIKCYTFMNPEAQVEYRYAQAFDQAITAFQAEHARSLRVTQLLTLSNAVALVMEYAPGRMLSEYLLEKKPMTEAEGKALRDAFFEFAKILPHVDFMHRDICPKNLLFDGTYLTLIDFQTASVKEDTHITNPSLCYIRGTLGLGAGYNPHRGVWNDVYSVAKNFEEVAPLIPFDVTKDLEALWEMARQAVTIQPIYTVDAAWKKEMRKAYIKLRLRPMWTCKKSSREKHRYLRTVLERLLKS